MKKLLQVTAMITASASILCGCQMLLEENQPSPADFSVRERTSSGTESTADERVSEITESHQPESEGETESSVMASSDVGSSAAESSASVVESSQESSDEEVPDEVLYPAYHIDPDVIYDFDSKYFVKNLSLRSLSHFAELYRAARRCQSDVYFKNAISSDELDMLMFLLNYECPELIHLMGEYQPSYVGDDCSMVNGVAFTYSMGREEYEAHLQELEKIFDELKQTLADASDFEKEQYIYNMIFDKCVYNESDLYAGSVYGVLVNGHGRCEGICKSFMWCMRELGCWCVCISGIPNWTDEAMYALHSWNVVKIGEDYYHVDLTVDNVKPDDYTVYPPCYGFFNVDEKTILSSRTISDFYRDLGLPECNSMELNYHVMNHLIVPGDTDAKQAFIDLLDQYMTEDGIESLSIQFETAKAYDEISDSINDILDDYAQAREGSGYSYEKYGNSLSQTIVLSVYPESEEEEE